MDQASNDCEGSIWSMISKSMGNSTALWNTEAPPWVSASEFRGTMAILQSCTLTLVACIYTALHLNVPDKTDFQSMLILKAQWVLLALFAPELVLYMAADQCQRAWSLRVELRQLQATCPLVDKKFNFDMKYSFFVVMGGVRIKLRNLREALSTYDLHPDWLFINELLQDENATLQLTPQGLLYLAQRSHWIYVSPEKIDDKSKADTVQKALVLLQVTWMAVTCITRRAYGLPLALLEIHTMVHVSCAISLYLFWFKKPLDVRVAEIVYDPTWHDTLASIVETTMSRPYGYPSFCLTRNLDVPYSDMAINWASLMATMRHSPHLIALALGLPIMYGGVHLCAWNFEFPTEQERVLWKIACFIIGGTFLLLACLGVLLWSLRLFQYILYRFCIWSCSQLVSRMEESYIGRKLDIRLHMNKVLMGLYRLVGIVALVLCSASRIFLVGESFISLRRVPIGVYWTPAWLLMIPHA